MSLYARFILSPNAAGKKKKEQIIKMDQKWQDRCVHVMHNVPERWKLITIYNEVL